MGLTSNLFSQLRKIVNLKLFLMQPTRPLHPWDFPGKSTGMDHQCLVLLGFNELVRRNKKAQNIFYEYYNKIMFQFHTIKVTGMWIK